MDYAAYCFRRSPPFPRREQVQRDFPTCESLSGTLQIDKHASRSTTIIVILFQVILLNVSNRPHVLDIVPCAYTLALGVLFVPSFLAPFTLGLYLHIIVQSEIVPPDLSISIIYIVTIRVDESNIVAAATNKNCGWLKHGLEKEAASVLFRTKMAA